MAELVTVFGGSGYLGRRIVRVLQAAGWRVRVAARGQHDPAMAAAGEVEVCATDVRDAASVRAALDGATAAVNAVSLYVEGRSARFEDVHVTGAGHVANAAAGRASLVHISGIGVDAASDSPYVRARARGEDAVRSVCPHAAILRPSVLFGGEDGFRATLLGLTRLPVIPLFGDGSVRLQPVHVDDVAGAVNASLALPGTVVGVLELGGDTILSYRELVGLALAHAGRRRPLLTVPFPCWRLLARGAGLLPRPPLTLDQVVLMEHDNVVAQAHDGFSALGMRPVGFGFDA